MHETCQRHRLHQHGSASRNSVRFVKLEIWNDEGRFSAHCITEFCYDYQDFKEDGLVLLRTKGASPIEGRPPPLDSAFTLRTCASQKAIVDMQLTRSIDMLEAKTRRDQEQGPNTKPTNCASSRLSKLQEASNQIQRRRLLLLEVMTRRWCCPRTDDCAFQRKWNTH